MVLLLIPLNPFISQIIQALLQKGVIAGAAPQIGGCADDIKTVVNRNISIKRNLILL